MIKTSFSQFRRRHAVTLIELLIVMGLLIILASISLGAMKSLLRGQKVSQAAVMVKQYLQNAQMRAVANGRPVAVFLDRVNMEGVAGSPTAANYSVTRMQFGEVFPPYTGDIEGVRGVLTEVDFSGLPDASSNIATSRGLDQHADQITFSLSDVAAGLSTDGFVKIGDLIEFEGYEGRYGIESITYPTASTVSVQFFNPPTGYSFTRSNKAAGSRHAIYEAADHAPVAPQIPLPLPIPGRELTSRFRIYRQPTRSLVGSVVLPRGTCVDLSLSGVGLQNSALDAGDFYLSSAPAGAGTGGNSDFSRIVIVFNSEGRMAYLVDENTMRTPVRLAMDGSSMLYLMVGRTDQVLPGFPSSALKIAAVQHPDFAASDLPKSNLVDPENVWVTVNPFTGEIKSSPVASVSDADLAAKISAVQGNPSISTVDIVSATRALAAAGQSN